jgi:hemoglobin-like flavoprotein
MCPLTFASFFRTAVLFPIISTFLFLSHSELFGFPEGTKFDDPALSENKVFIGKGSRLIKAIDQAASFLGPDLEPFEAQLYELGWRHVAMKAQPAFWPIVGEALMCVFEDCMIGGFTPEEREAWTIVSMKIINVFVVRESSIFISWSCKLNSHHNPAHYFFVQTDLQLHGISHDPRLGCPLQGNRREGTFG